MDKQIGQRLREMRLKAKLSQAKVAAVVGSRQSAVARFESGKAHVPANVMVGYADYFDVSLDYIFGRTDNPHGTHYEGKVKIEKAYRFGFGLPWCTIHGSPIIGLSIFFLAALLQRPVAKSIQFMYNHS